MKKQEIILLACPGTGIHAQSVLAHEHFKSAGQEVLVIDEIKKDVNGTQFQPEPFVIKNWAEFPEPFIDPGTKVFNYAKHRQTCDRNRQKRKSKKKHRR